MLKVFNDIDQWRKLRQQNFLQNKSIGFVPTMGNLHVGHKSLLARSKIENEFTVLSIYVNPTQFDQIDDFKKYPHTLQHDLSMAEEIGVDFALLPDYQSLYPDDYCYRVVESDLSQKLCGKFRPGHFDGVLTVVLKLLQLVKPMRAYFGAKDFQQLQLVQGMVAAFFVDTKIISCPTIRDEDGLALSSRNSQLTSEQLILAKKFSKLLCSHDLPTVIKQKLIELGFVVDYIEDIGSRRFGAVHLGVVRLIDNVIKK